MPKLHRLLPLAVAIGALCTANLASARPHGGHDNDPPTGPRTSPTQVPEPGTLALLGIGQAGIGVMRRSKR